MRIRRVAEVVRWESTSKIVIIGSREAIAWTGDTLWQVS